MNTLQTLLALVVLIYVLSVIVQALQEAFKGLYKSKTKTMEKAITDFMGAHLTLPQVRTALQQRGLDLPALENFNKEDFRHLLDGIQGLEPQLQGIVADAQATFEQKKDNIAAAFEAARAKFQVSYTKHNKIWVLIFSAIVVLALNANLIFLYQELAADQAMSQAIATTADKLIHSQGKEAAEASDGANKKTAQGKGTQSEEKPPSAGNSATQPPQKSATPQKTRQGVGQKQGESQAGTAPPMKQGSDLAGSQPGKTNSQQKDVCSQQSSSTDLAQDYKGTRDCVKKLLDKYPILVRWSPDEKGLHGWVAQLTEDTGEGWPQTIMGLLLMWILVSLGAPFWNDVLKGMTGVNNALNTGGKKTS
jgi:hypothetical protein